MVGWTQRVSPLCLLPLSSGWEHPGWLFLGSGLGKHWVVGSQQSRVKEGHGTECVNLAFSGALNATGNFQINVLFSIVPLPFLLWLLLLCLCLGLCHTHTCSFWSAYLILGP